MTSARQSSIVKASQGETIVHMFCFPAIFILSSITLVTKQTKTKAKQKKQQQQHKQNKRTTYVSTGWGLEERRVSISTRGRCISFKCHSLFYCRTKRYSRSTCLSRRLTQFYYVPYAITLEKVCEIQDLCVLC